MQTGEYIKISIPNNLMHQAHLGTGKFSFEVRSDGFLIKPADHPRAGWEKYYAAEPKEENLLI